jgi:DNA-binding MarR family transcriptional regulator
MALERMREVLPDLDLHAASLIFNLIRAANRVVQDVEASVHRPLGLSWAGFRILFTLLTVGPSEAREVARLAGVSRATVSSVLDTLERDGLVERRRESTDRRLVTVALTGQGKRAVVEALGRHHERERAWVAPLDRDEQAVLVALLRRLLASQPAHQTTAGGGTSDGKR